MLDPEEFTATRIKTDARRRELPAWYISDLLEEQREIELMSEALYTNLFNEMTKRGQTIVELESDLNSTLKDNAQLKTQLAAQKAITLEDHEEFQSMIGNKHDKEKSVRATPPTEGLKLLATNYVEEAAPDSLEHVIGISVMYALGMYDEVNDQIASMKHEGRKEALLRVGAFMALVANAPEGLSSAVSHDAFNAEMVDKFRDAAMSIGINMDTRDWKRAECLQILNDAKLDRAVSANLFTAEPA